MATLKYVKLQIIDNLLPEEDFQYIKTIILGDTFPWFFCNYVTDKNIPEPRGHRQFQFYCSLYSTNEGMQSNIAQNILMKFKDRLNISSFMRAKLNLTQQKNEVKINQFHTDFPTVRHYTTAVFYLNTNDGYTLFKNGDKVDSIENRIVIFNGNTPHCGSSCTNANRRVVLNLNYVK